MPPPERWDQYEALGDVVHGTKFVPFKVPLKRELLSTVKEDERFGPQDVIQKLKDKGKQLGLVIDITYTDKYYHKGDFCRQNIEHEKIYTGGHVVPDDAVVYRFFDVVEKFVLRMKTDDIVIGVHCTHGVNRTGYIVCRYMVERLGIDPTEAMNAFNKARGHRIERENYIEDLLNRKYNPDYVIGDHPPVYKDTGKQNSRHKPRHRHQNRAPPSTRDISNDQQQQSHYKNFRPIPYGQPSYNNNHGKYGNQSYYNSTEDNRYGYQSHYNSNKDNWKHGHHHDERYNSHNGVGARNYHSSREAHRPYHHRTLHSNKSYPPRTDFRHHDNGYKRKSRHQSYHDKSI